MYVITDLFLTVYTAHIVPALSPKILPQIIEQEDPFYFLSFSDTRNSESDPGYYFFYKFFIRIVKIHFSQPIRIFSLKIIWKTVFREA